jgi:hypothetical protein
MCCWKELVADPLDLPLGILAISNLQIFNGSQILLLGRRWISEVLIKLPEACPEDILAMISVEFMEANLLTGKFQR